MNELPILQVCSVLDPNLVIVEAQRHVIMAKHGALPEFQTLLQTSQSVALPERSRERLGAVHRLCTRLQLPM